MAKPAKRRSQKTGHGSRTAHERDSNVRISPSWLKAVLDQRGITTSDLARTTGLSQQSLDAILHSPESRMMRASRRVLLARSLNVAEELLAGEAMYLPQGTGLGFEYAYSTRTLLAAQRLLTECDKAVKRDLEEFSTDASITDYDLAWLTLDEIVRHLMQVGSWRERVLRWDPPRARRQGYREPQSLTPDTPGGQRDENAAHEAGVLALIAAIEHILTPWLQNEARLDYAALREFASSEPPRHTAARQDPRAIIVPSDVTPTKKATT